MLAGLLSGLGVAIAVGQAFHQLTQRRRDRLDAGMRPLVLTVLDTGRLPAIDVLTRAQRRRLHTQAVAFLAKVRGEDHERLLTLLTRMGAVDAALRDVRRRRPLARARAALLIGATRRDDLLHELTVLLDDRRPEVRIAAVRAIANVPTARAVRPLLAAVNARRSVPAGVVAMALVQVGEVAAEPLRVALRTEAPVVRRIAALVLGHIHDLGALEALVAVLQRDPDPSVRAAAAEALGRLGLPRTIAPLVASLQRDGDPVRRAAVAALGRLGAPEAAAPLADVALAADDGLARDAARALVAVDAVRLAQVASYRAYRDYAREAIALADLDHERDVRANRTREPRSA